MNLLASATGEDFVAELVDRALRMGASAAQARVEKTRYFEIDFNHRGVDLLRTTENETTTITVFREGKRGAATLNGRATEEIEDALDAALTAADAGLADPANDVADAVSLPPSSHGPLEADPEQMAARVEEFIVALAAAYPQVRTRNSLYDFTNVETAFANSRGVRQKEQRGRYGFNALFMAKDGRRTTSMNYSGGSAFAPFASLLDAGSVRRLLRETTQSLERAPAPGKFIGDVIIAPDCLASIMGSVANALSGGALFTGATPYKNRKGEAIASPLFSLSNRPRGGEFAGGADFDGYGVPTQNLEVVRDGVLEEFLIDCFYARKLGVAQTAGAYNFSVGAGDKTLDEMIANTKRGILFGRFSGGAPNSNLDFSGIAKNSFYIEGGRVRHALEETMVSGNFQELLQNIHAVSREYVNFGHACYPFVAASGVTISSK
jgi:PmbA protein